MKVTDEMVNIACEAYSNGHPYDEPHKSGMRTALEAAFDVMEKERADNVPIRAMGGFILEGALYEPPLVKKEIGSI